MDSLTLPLILLAIFLVPAIVLVVLLRWFWRLSKPPATDGTAPAAWVSWLQLIGLAVAVCLVVFGWQLGGITRSSDGSWPNAHTLASHKNALKLTGWVGLLISLLLLVARFGQLRPALSFAAGTLLVLAGASGFWYAIQHKMQQRLRWADESSQHRGWQQAVVDAFEARDYRERLRWADIAQQKPAFPGGEQALARAIRQRVRYPAGYEKKAGVVAVRFVVEADGRLALAHVIQSNGLGPGYDEEAVRVVSSLPRFVPGRQEGQAVPIVCETVVPFERWVIW